MAFEWERIEKGVSLRGVGVIREEKERCSVKWERMEMGSQCVEWERMEKRSR